MFFVLLRPIFWEKWKIAPPPPIRKQPPSNVWICEIGRKISLDIGEDLFFFFALETNSEFRTSAKKSLSILVKTFFFFFFFLEITWFWAEKTFDFRISAEKSLSILVKTFFFFFFVLEMTWFWAEKNLWISDFGRKITLNFGEDLFFFFFFGDHLILDGKKLWISELSEKFRLNFRTNRLKLLLDQWKFESRSFAHFSLFQNSPPLFQILTTRLVVRNADLHTAFTVYVQIFYKPIPRVRISSRQSRIYGRGEQYFTSTTCKGSRPPQSSDEGMGESWLVCWSIFGQPFCFCLLSTPLTNPLGRNRLCCFFFKFLRILIFNWTSCIVRLHFSLLLIVQSPWNAFLLIVDRNYS